MSWQSHLTPYESALTKALDAHIEILYLNLQQATKHNKTKILYEIAFTKSKRAKIVNRGSARARLSEMRKGRPVRPYKKFQAGGSIRVAVGESHRTIRSSR
jgi:hypothetical protein